MKYTYANNDQPYKGDDGPLLGLLAWPDTNNAAQLAHAGRARAPAHDLAAAAEIDNPYFNVNKNKQQLEDEPPHRQRGLHAHAVLVGLHQDQHRRRRLHEPEPDAAASRERDRRSPTAAFSTSTTTSRATSTRRRCSTSTPHARQGPVAQRLRGQRGLRTTKSTVDGAEGTELPRSELHLRSTTRGTKSSRTVITQRRLVSAFGRRRRLPQLPVRDGHRPERLDVDDSGRRATRSSIPSVSASFIFTDAFPSLQQYMTGKLRAAYAEVGRDARAVLLPHDARVQDDVFRRLRLRLHRARTRASKPEFAKSYEFGTELELPQRPPRGRRDGLPQADAEPDRPEPPRELRHGLHSLQPERRDDARTRASRSRVRGDAGRSVATSRGTSSRTSRRRAARRSRCRTRCPESYVSDTWLYGNVRNGTEPGLSTMSLTGLFYLRNNNGRHPDRSDHRPAAPLARTFIDAGYDRQPNFTVGLTNNVPVQAVEP